MYCTHCGAEIEDSAKYCVSCGEPVEEQSKGSDGNSTFKAETYSAPPKNPKGGNDKLNKTLMWILIALAIIVIVIVAIIFNSNSNEENNVQQTTTEISTVVEQTESPVVVQKTARRAVSRTQNNNSKQSDRVVVKMGSFDAYDWNDQVHYKFSDYKDMMSAADRGQFAKGNIRCIPVNMRYEDSGDTLKLECIIYNGYDVTVTNIRFMDFNLYYSTDGENVRQLLRTDVSPIYELTNGEPTILKSDEFTLCTLTFKQSECRNQTNGFYMYDENVPKDAYLLTLSTPYCNVK